MAYLRAFIAAFMATLVFHQGVLALLHFSGVVPAAPYSLAPTWPLGVPSVLSLAFWGGVWGLILWPFIRGRTGAGYWLRAPAIGAIAPTLVAMLVVLPLKGMPVRPAMVPLGVVLNGIWGVGTAGLILPLRRVLRS